MLYRLAFYICPHPLSLCFPAGLLHNGDAQLILSEIINERHCVSSECSVKYLPGCGAVCFVSGLL